MINGARHKSFPSVGEVRHQALSITTRNQTLLESCLEKMIVKPTQTPPWAAQNSKALSLKLPTTTLKDKPTLIGIKNYIE